MKECKQCKRELPCNKDYYFKKKDLKDGFATKCKECMGYNFTNKLTKIPKQGCKFCVKCDRELKLTASYFPPDKGCKDGFRGVCRECGKDGHFMDENYIPKKMWTKKENQEFIERYPHYTNEELMEIYYPDESFKSLHDRAYKLGVKKSDHTNERRYKLHSEKMFGVDSPLYGIKRSEETKKKLSEAAKGRYIGEKSVWFGKKRSEDQRNYLSKIKKESGQWKGENNPRYLNPLNGEDNPNWQGGITQLNFWLRNNLQDWKQKTIKHCNYKCVITGDVFDDIHHLHSFNMIYKEALKICNLENVTNVSELEDDQEFLTRFKELHDSYGLGVCLRSDVHKLFHDIYGYSSNTPEQFNEFHNRYKLGEFKSTLGGELANV